MQYRPTAAELLDVVAELLEAEVLPAVSGPLQHKARVAAHLTRMVQRELGLGAPADEDEHRRLAAIVGDEEADLVELRARVRDRLLDPAPLGAALSAELHGALLATARADLAICKPGYDAWEGG